MRVSNEDLFFELREVISKPNSGDSTIIEFYSLEEVKNRCISGYYFRRKNYKSYNDGKPHGTWMSYSIHGELTRKTEYDHGNIVKDETF